MTVCNENGGIHVMLGKP